MYVAFVLIVTVAMPSGYALGIEKPLGVYGDWSAHVLRDGELQVCYAETKLNIASEANQKYSDIRLQVTNRSFDSGSYLIRFTSVDKNLSYSLWLYFGSTEFMMEYFLDPESLDTPLDYVMTTAIMKMKSGEIDKVVMKDGPSMTDYHNSLILGTYSLHGFTQAYDALDRTCPGRPGRAADVEPQPIKLSDPLVFTGPSLYVELSLTGPFFEPDKAETLTIRGNPYRARASWPSDFEMVAGAPMYILRNYTSRIEYYRNGTLVTNIYQPHPEIYGICLDPESRRLKILMNSWSGAAGAAVSKEAVYFVPDVGFVSDVLYSSDISPPSPVNCSENEQIWPEGSKQFIPCQCAGQSADQPYLPTLDELVDDIAYQDEIGTDTLSALLSRLARLQPFMWWDASSIIDTQQFNSSKFSIVAITYHSKADIYDSVQLIFGRRLTDNFWTQVYEIRLNSKSSIMRLFTDFMITKIWTWICVLKIVIGGEDTSVYK